MRKAIEGEERKFLKKGKDPLFLMGGGNQGKKKRESLPFGRKKGRGRNNLLKKTNHPGKGERGEGVFPEPQKKNGKKGGGLG